MTNLIALSVIIALGAHRQAEQRFDHNQYADAAILCRHALEQVEPETLEAALLFRDLARAYRREGFLIRAEAAQQQQIEILRTRLGEHDGNIAIELDRLGEMYFEQGRFREARNTFQRALRIAEMSLDPDNPVYPTILNDLGAADYLDHRYGDAAKYLRRSLALHESPVTRANLAELERRLALRR